MTHLTRSRQQSFLLILTLGVLNALTPFSIDLYLSTFPQIARDLGTDIGRMALTVSVYFIGFAIGQILYGPLLDHFGRKRPIYAGIGVYILATLGCAQARSIEALLAFRFLSALGGAAASVGSMTLVRDLFPARESARVLSHLMLVLSASPLFAPTLGTFAAAAWGWRSLFWLLGGLAAVDLALVLWVLPPSRPGDPKTQLGIAPITRTFWRILQDPVFRDYTFAGSLSFAPLFVFVAGSPAIFIEQFHLPPEQYGLLFALLAGGMIVGGQLNHVLTRRWDHRRVFQGALAAQFAGGVAFTIISVLPGALSLVTTVVLLLVILMCAGITYPNAAAIALEPYSENTGSAASLLGFLQLGLGSILSATAGMLGVSGAFPVAAVTAGATGLALLILARGARGKE